ncbi:MAG: hypothetical protein ACP5U2_09180 [Bryobacteraceae bacterium]
MKNRRIRWPLVVAAALALFAATAILTLAFLPRPWRRGDYLVAGSVATLVTLLAMFVFLLIAGLLSSRPFPRKRRSR